jgi:hypothetical protein
MRRFVTVMALALCLVAAAAQAAAAQSSPVRPGGPVTDDPTEPAQGGLGLDGAGYSTVDPFLGGQSATGKSRRRADDVRLIGALRLDPFNAGVHADVAGYKNLAFVGKWRETCPGTGVDIIDISRRRAPVKIADTLDYADTSMEDMQAIRIRGRDILAIGLQDCGNSATEGTVGLELYDITDPRNPQFLSLFNGEDFGMEAAHGHVHEFDLVKRRDGRVLAALASPDSEALTADPETALGGIGDALIVDITDPASPTLVGEYGVLDDLGVDFYLDVQQGDDARTYDHSARFNRRGTRLYLSYWDAGVIILDVRDPANPTRLGRTAYAPGEEGNAHSIDTADRETILIQADEDLSPFELQFTSNAFEGLRPAVEADNTPPIVRLPDRELAGEVVHVGRGCPADPETGLEVDDPYLADPAGKIALIERGLCRFDNKIARAQLAGAVGVIVYNNEAGGEGLVLMGIDSPVLSGPPGIVGTEITIPAVFVQRSTGLLLRDAAPPVTARAAAVFNGWGYLRFFDISDPANPVQLSTFATPNTNNEAVALEGDWSVHNPELLRRRPDDNDRANILYASWYSDGVRVLNIKDPSRPREVAFWTGEGAPADAPPVNIWSVVPHRRILLASDRNFGLYVLKHRGDRR